MLEAMASRMKAMEAEMSATRSNFAKQERRIEKLLASVEAIKGSVKVCPSDIHKRYDDHMRWTSQKVLLLEERSLITNDTLFELKWKVPLIEGDRDAQRVRIDWLEEQRHRHDGRIHDLERKTKRNDDEVKKVNWWAHKQKLEIEEIKADANDGQHRVTKDLEEKTDNVISSVADYSLQLYDLRDRILQLEEAHR